MFIDSVSNPVQVVKFDGRTVDAFKDLLLCPGDVVLTGPTGRVAIRFDEQRTVIRLDGSTSAKILSGGTGEGDVALLDGILHFLSSVRRRFQVDTPYFVAGIDGTEALMSVQPIRRRALAAVRQGLISAYGRQVSREDPLLVEEGEAAFTSPRYKLQSAPISDLPAEFRGLLIVSDSAVDWAVYYPPILLVRDTRNKAVRRAIILLASGDYDRAAAALDAGGGAQPAATAALRTIIAVGRNRLAEAEKWSELALKADPDFAPAYVAASYVRQAQGDLEGALDFAGKAAEIGRDEAYALARLAELQMTVGDRRAALKTANSSLEIAPSPLALFVAGLANLTAWHYAKAEEQFLQGITIGDEMPLLRLGLGLLYIRQGLTAAGTWEIERAAALDPNRSALRTWLGRAYFDEGLTEKAADQFRLAAILDQNDSRPLEFSALERVAANRPIQALGDLLAAEERGSARSVIRSKRGLAEDDAARGATLGRVFDILSFDQLAITSGSRAADTDPSNPAAHRFLADFYRSQPGSGVSQTSELLRAQLLSPPSKIPVQPQLGEGDLAILNTTGIARVTFAEFSPLFDADGLRIDASGLAGTQDTWGYEAAATVLYRGFSFSVGEFHYETDGFRENNDLKHDIFDVVSTVALSPEFTLFGEYRDRETEGGDRRLNFNINDFDDSSRAALDRKVARLGFHAQPTAKSDLIGVYTWANLSTGESIDFLGNTFTTVDDEEAQSGQLQYLRTDGKLQSVIGGTYIHTDRSINPNFGGFPLSPIIRDSEYYNAYAYLYLEHPANVLWTLGGSVASYEEFGGQPDAPQIFKLHPKIGVTASFADNITVRAAYLRNLKPNRVSEQLIEPTTIAGFNQFFDAFEGSVLEQASAGIELKLNKQFWIGGEATHRWWDVPVLGASDAQVTEHIYRGYIYVPLSEDLAISADILYEDSRSDVPLDIDEWSVLSIPVTLSFFSDLGIFGSIGVEFVDHRFEDGGNSGNDTFAVFDAAIGYRMPRNSGIISIEIQNLFDEKIRFQNRSIRPDLTAQPRFAPERAILARVTVNF